jgi:isopenicillin N synthase-like dioxygenase
VRATGLAHGVFLDVSGPGDAGFPELEEALDEWSSLMASALDTVVQMVAAGLGLPHSTILDLAKNGSHRFRPMATGLGGELKQGTVLAGELRPAAWLPAALTASAAPHCDVCLLTIHGKARYPGLNIWPRNGSHKLPVRMPDGCLLIQVGKELEYLTGGHIRAIYHEVVISDATIEVSPAEPPALCLL